MLILTKKDKTSEYYVTTKANITQKGCYIFIHLIDDTSDNVSVLMSAVMETKRVDFCIEVETEDTAVQFYNEFNEWIHKDQTFDQSFSRLSNAYLAGRQISSTSFHQNLRPSAHSAVSKILSEQGPSRIPSQKLRHSKIVESNGESSHHVHE